MNNLSHSLIQLLRLRNTRSIFTPQSIVREKYFLMSRLFSCPSLFGRISSCRYQHAPAPQQQQQPPSEAPHKQQQQHRAGQNERQRDGGANSDGVGSGAADSAGTSLFGGWRLWLACGAASLVPLTDLWSERLNRRNQWWRPASGGLGGFGSGRSVGVAQCMLDGPVARRPAPQPQQKQKQQPLEEVARSLTARSVEQACRLCTSRAVAEARAGRPDRARAMWLSAASFSYPPALFNLGLLAASAGSSAEAVAYYRAAADLGHPAAAFNLSVMLRQQEEEEQDGDEPLTVGAGAVALQPPDASSESRRWLSRAASSGLAEALLLEAEQLLDESRPAEAEQRLRRLLASQTASASATAAAELLLCRCHRDLSNSVSSSDSSDCGGGGGLRRCSRSSPNFSSFDIGGGGGELRLVGTQAKAHFYPSFYSKCKQLHKY